LQNDPVKAHIVTMTNWIPNLEARSGPLYVAIANQLANDLETGRLKPGDRLPTHRELAWQLGVTVGTITRAYAEAEHRGLITGEVGRGTFVRDRGVDAAAPPAVSAADDDFVDLALNLPIGGIADAVLARVLAEVAAAADLPRLLGYASNVGLPPHRAAGSEWLARSGLNAPPGEIAITCGAQHGMVAALAALGGADAIVLTEQLTFYGMKSLATFMSLRLHGVAMDEHGLIPEALEAACRQTTPKALYCIPTLQNPTAAVMPPERREAVAAICRRRGVMIVEDDIYGFLSADGPPPISSFAPEQSIYVTSLSKCVAPGLRVGYVRAPSALIERIGAAVRASTWMAAPPLAEAASRLIRSGEARRLAEAQRAEATARQKIAARLLDGFDVATHPASFHVWLNLPEPWRREEFTVQARQRRVGVASAEAFAVGRAPVPHAVRIGLSAARDHATLERALTALARLLREPPDRSIALV
jgi:DNA-binding transcriptional MocR family regulator